MKPLMNIIKTPNLIHYRHSILKKIKSFKLRGPFENRLYTIVKGISIHFNFAMQKMDVGLTIEVETEI